jgi:transposase
VVLSIDEKTQVQALDRTQPLLPIDFGVTEKRTHDYIRHGTTNLFAALQVGSGEIYGECHPTRDGAQFLAFLKAAVKPHAGKDMHVVLDNLSTHTTPDIAQWLTDNPHVSFQFTPIGSSWMNQIETWFGIITRQAIRRGTFEHWNERRRPTLRLDRDHRRDPRQGRTHPNQHPPTRRQQRQVNETESRDTSRYGGGLKQNASR